MQAVSTCWYTSQVRLLLLVVLCRKTSLQSELDQLKKEIETQAQNSKHKVSSVTVFYGPVYLQSTMQL